MGDKPNSYPPPLSYDPNWEDKMGANNRRSNVLVFERKIIYSEAFHKLSGIAKTVYFIFLDRRQMSKIGNKGKERVVITNNGDIVFSYEEALKSFNITKSRFVRALDTLIKYGFIDINHHGGGMNKDCTTYYISERWLLYGKDNFLIKTRPKDTRKLGFASNISNESVT
jgi:hypothetical protein